MATLLKNPAKRPRFRRMRAFATRFPRWIRISTGALIAVGLAASAYYLFHIRPEAQKQQRISEQWGNFDRAAKTGSDADLDKALEEILRLNPDDSLARQRKTTLESGSAGESDPVMPLLTLPKHLRAGRWPEAEREASKRLVHQPKDWLARCTVAKAGLLRGDRAAAVRDLDKLPDPKDAFANVTPASLLFAFDLFRELDRDATALRGFVREVVVETARTSAAESFPAAVKVQLVECYLEGFEPKTDRPQPSGLSRAVLPVGKLVELALVDPALDAPIASKLGLACNRLVSAFALLRRESQITAEQYSSIAKDHEARTSKVWQTLIARDPQAAQAYHGLATAALRAEDVPSARQHVLRGLEACGDNAALLALYSLLLRADEQLLPALARLLQSVERDPKNVSLWLLTADTAEAAGRRDVALEACRKARKLEPKNPWVIRAEARINIEAGGTFAHAGVQLLALLGEALPGDPLAARLYVRGLNEAGLGILVADFLTKVEAASAKAKSPTPIAQALRGLCDSRYDAALADLTQRTARANLDRFPGDLELLSVQALMHFQSAERGEPRWSITETGGAIRAFEELQSRAPDRLEIAAALAWTRLKGKKEPAVALRDATVLSAAAERGEPLSAWQWQVLGATLLANEQLDGAIRALEKAGRMSKTSAGSRIHLALAYHGQGRKAEARATLELARGLPRTAQEQADYFDAFAILQREKS